MKILIAMFALFAAAKEAAPQHYDGFVLVEYVLAQIIQPSAPVVTELIREVFHNDIKAGGEIALRKIDECRAKARSRNVTTCAKLDVIIHECLPQVMEYYETFSSENLKDIAKTISDGQTAVTQHICNSRTEEFLELFNECLSRPGTQEQNDQMTKTFEEKAKIFKAAPTKANFCGIGNGLRPMLEAKIKLSCQSNITVKAYTALYDAYTKPCQV